MLGAHVLTYQSCKVYHILTNISNITLIGKIIMNAEDNLKVSVLLFSDLDYYDLDDYDLDYYNLDDYDLDGSY